MPLENERKDEIHLDPAIPPDQMLSMMILDLKRLLMNIEVACSLALETDSTKDEITEANEMILRSAQSIHRAFDAGQNYLQERKKLRDTQIDAEG